MCKKKQAKQKAFKSSYATTNQTEKIELGIVGHWYISPTTILQWANNINIRNYTNK